MSAWEKQVRDGKEDPSREGATGSAAAGMCAAAPSPGRAETPDENAPRRTRRRVRRHRGAGTLVALHLACVLLPLGVVVALGVHQFVALARPVAAVVFRARTGRNIRADAETGARAGAKRGHSACGGGAFHAGGVFGGPGADPPPLLRARGVPLRHGAAFPHSHHGVRHGRAGGVHPCGAGGHRGGRGAGAHHRGLALRHDHHDRCDRGGGHASGRAGARAGRGAVFHAGARAAAAASAGRAVGGRPCPTSFRSRSISSRCS